MHEDLCDKSIYDFNLTKIYMDPNKSVDKFEKDGYDINDYNE
jgi:hypothetical protein